MAHTTDNDARPSTARSGQRRPARQRPLASEAAAVLTPDGHQWLLARAAWLAAQPDQAGRGDEGYPRGAAELARLNEILALAITTEELPPELPGVVELGDEVLVEFAADEVERFLLVDPVEAPLDDVRISVESPLAKAVLGRRVGEQVEVDAPSVATAAASSPPVGTGRVGRRRPTAAMASARRRDRWCLSARASWARMSRTPGPGPSSSRCSSGPAGGDRAVRPAGRHRAHPGRGHPAHQGRHRLPAGRR